jgi:DNA-binding response OmpR family regulator
VAEDLEAITEANNARIKGHGYKMIVSLINHSEIVLPTDELLEALGSEFWGVRLRRVHVLQLRQKFGCLYN